MDVRTDKLEVLYAEVFETLDGKRPVPVIHVRFYPYVGIHHTIRVRDTEVYVRISEICRGMPYAAHRGLAFILVAKLLRKKVPQNARFVYTEFIKTKEIRDRAAENKKARGRKVVTTSKGQTYDLEAVFDALNHDYFRNSLPKPVLTWSARKTYRILGHHDATHETVAISRSLDDPSVPKYVVDYVVFHEMLHIAHPTVHHNGRRYNHTPAFRKDEQEFVYFDDAERWIERNVRKLKRNATKRH
ncbi:MAG: SprT-like domain-containing protein [Pyrinomonadaceae bacterium]